MSDLPDGWPYRPVSKLSFAMVDALMRYWFNTEPDDLFRVVYTDPAPSYVEEKLRIWKHGLPAFWGQLDNAHRWKLVNAAWDKYGEEAMSK